MKCEKRETPQSWSRRNASAGWAEDIPETRARRRAWRAAGPRRAEARKSESWTIPGVGSNVIYLEYCCPPDRAAPDFHVIDRAAT